MPLGTIVFRRFILTTKKQNNMGFIIKKSITYNMMERRMMFVCGDDIASLIKRFENESK